MDAGLFTAGVIGSGLFTGGAAGAGGSAGAAISAGGATGSGLFTSCSTAAGSPSFAGETGVSMNGSIVKGVAHLVHFACLPMFVSLTLNFDLQLGHCVFIE
jgi:hypothetical protein